jgi:hypothetical protein
MTNGGRDECPGRRFHLPSGIILESQVVGLYIHGRPEEGIVCGTFEGVGE